MPNTGGAIDIYFETHGDKSNSPLLLVNGFSNQLVSWHPELIAALVNRGFFVIVYDNRDVGLSTHFDGVKAAKWFALPTFTSPSFDVNAILLFLPVVLVLIAENVGHVKAVAAMTGKDLDDQMGTALMADGVATTLAGFGGGSGTTTYAENIGVMAATKVYSTAAYWIAGVGAIGLSLSPKFGAVLSATPVGALGGVGVALFGMIGVVGARIWIEGKVDFANSTNLLIAGSALIIGIADMSWTRGDYTFNGIINATLVAILGYRLLHSIADARGNK